MVRKVATICECDACPHTEIVESPKRLIFGYGRAPYPPGWQFIKFGDSEGDWLCPKCARGAQQAYTDYKRKRQSTESKGRRK